MSSLGIGVATAAFSAAKVAQLSKLGNAKVIVENPSGAEAKVAEVVGEPGKLGVANRTTNNGFYEVLTEVPISGTSRSAHRTSATQRLWTKVQRLLSGLKVPLLKNYISGITI